MSVKSKIMNAMVAHPKIVTFAVGLTITLAIGTTIASLSNQQASAVFESLYR